MDTSKRAYCGNMYQLCGTRSYRLTDGFTDGCRCIDVRTGSGLDFTVVRDRAMDISLASYKGTNLVFLTPNAETHPAYYESFGTEWLRTFSAGLLTTLGPTYLGQPCVDEGEALGLHGRISTAPARKVCDLSDPINGKIRIEGTITDAFTFGHKLEIRRIITASSEEPRLVITDEIENYGGSAVPLCMLYHINFGYPLLSEDAVLLVPEDGVPYEDDGVKYPADHIGSPDSSKNERNYAYTFTGETAAVGIWNPVLEGGLGVYVRFDPRQLPYMNEWVLENPADYIAALEPATCPCESRSILRERNQLPMIEAGEKRTISVEIGVIRSENQRVSLFGK